MRLPCDRFLRILLFQGDPISVVHDQLVELGYPSDNDLVEEEFQRIVQEVSHVAVPGSCRPDQVSMLRWQLDSAFNESGVMPSIRYLLKYPELRSALEMLIVAERKDEVICQSLQETNEVTMDPEGVAAYRNLVFDLSLLAPWELSVFMDIHSNGKSMRVAKTLGREGLEFYAGGDVVFRPDEALSTACTGAFFRLKELLLTGDTRKDAAAAARWANTFKSMYELLGPTVAFRQLMDMIAKVTVATVPVPAAKLGPGLSVSGTFGGRVGLGDVQELMLKVQERFGGMLAAPGDVPPAEQPEE